jgi:hypothetical protein
MEHVLTVETTAAVLRWYRVETLSSILHHNVMGGKIRTLCYFALELMELNIPGCHLNQDVGEAAEAIRCCTENRSRLHKCL